MTIFEKVEAAVQQLNWQREPLGLYAPIGYTLESGGKRLRPSLALMACELVGGKAEDAMPAALALEVFHNFTLLHDDVMDRASVRRGRPTVHVRWNDNTAILSGDEMVFDAYKLLEQVPVQHLPQVLHLFTKMASEICEGQQYDVDFEQMEDVSIDQYIDMIRLKTSVLLGTALQIGAIIGGADCATQQALYNFGIHLGLAFQIQDDILDVYGDERTFGKAIGGDILCNKKSYVMLTALHMASPEQLTRLHDWMHRVDFVPAEKIAAVTAIYDEIGVRAVAEKAMEEHTANAVRNLCEVAANDAKKQPLLDLTDRLLHRQS